MRTYLFTVPLAAFMTAVAAQPVMGGEELMPLAAGAGQWNAVQADNSPYLRRITSNDDDTPRQRVFHKNTVKLTLPGKKEDAGRGDRKLHVVEAKQNAEDGSLMFDLDAPLETFVSSSDTVTAAGQTPKMERLHILPDLPAERSPVPFNPFEPEGTADLLDLPGIDPAASFAPVSGFGMLSPAPLPELAPTAAYQGQAIPRVESSAPTSAAFHAASFDSLADIPGLVPPEIIARDRRSPAATGFGSGMSLRDDTVDLISFGGTNSFQDFIPLPDPVAAPALPSLHDPAVDTLEPFVPLPSRSKPKPAQVELPPPIAPEAFDVFSGAGPVPKKENRPGSKNQTNIGLQHPKTAPAAAPEGSLRPPAHGGRPLGILDTPASAPRMDAPLGLTITGSPSQFAGHGMLDITGSSPIVNRPPPRAMAQSPRPRRPAPRMAPAMDERITPEAAEGDEEGFTPMRSMRNLLGG